jgi:hypothetical protein
MNVLRAVTKNDVEAVKEWLAAPRARHPAQVMLVLGMAARNGQDAICQLILDSGEAFEGAILSALYQACTFDRQSTAQLLVQHCPINLHNMSEGLLRACVNGHMRIVTWLMSDVMQLSQSDRIKWLLITACARGDMSVVKQLVTLVDSDMTTHHE